MNLTTMNKHTKNIQIIAKVYYNLQYIYSDRSNKLNRHDKTIIILLITKVWI